jgi:hypothetical protein
MKTNNILSIALLNYDKINKNNIKISELKNDEYEILGYYDKINKIWSWSYIFNKSNIKKIIDLLYEENENNEELNIIRYTFINSKFIITNDIQLDIILALSLYYLKLSNIYIHNINENYIKYLIKSI